jgi:S1-C subfamily serine protease
MVPSNVLTRVFCVKIGENIGSAFTIEDAGRQYLITARHVVPESSGARTIEILEGGAWKPLSVQSLQVRPLDVDVAVLVASRRIGGPSLPVTVAMDGTYLSQEVYFVGFPFGLTMGGEKLNSGFPIPFVKHGIIAALEVAPGPFFVDGMNNPGFSGGPVVRVDSGGSATIIGVVSSYRVSFDPILSKKGEPLEAVARSNAGLLAAYSIEYAIASIRRVPSTN